MFTHILINCQVNTMQATDIASTVLQAVCNKVWLDRAEFQHQKTKNRTEVQAQEGKNWGPVFSHSYRYIYMCV